MPIFQNTITIIFFNTKYKPNIILYYKIPIRYYPIQNYNIKSYFIQICIIKYNTNNKK